ncbi:MAG: glycosyl hydrolase family 18 protein [Microgenomates group bacterium]
MRKILFPLCVLGLLIGLGYLTMNPEKKSTQTNLKSPFFPSPTPASLDMKSSIFIPYWSSGAVADNSLYDSHYYFGIEPTKDGFIKDANEQKRVQLMEGVSSKKRQVVLRMLNPDLNTTILENTLTQKKLAKELNGFLVKNEYQGVVIDLEVSFTLREQTQNEITQFVQTLCTEIHDNYKSCSMLIYGDLFYRKRPYDLKKLGGIVDKIHLMAYDFHKAGGEPGPNFPFDRRSLASEGGLDYDYDFQQMISDFLTYVPKEKIEVVFGMYGYDWTLNEQGTPLKAATALSLSEIENALGRQYPTKKNSAREKSIEYTDENGKKHIVWYEDTESVKVKTEYLLRRGVGQVSFWAWGYF